MASFFNIGYGRAIDPLGFFGKGLFGGDKGSGGMDYPDTPKLTLQDYDVWLNQIDDLIGQWDDIKTGKSMFDAEKFIYQPQRTMLEQAYGIGAPGVLAGQNSLGESNDLFARGGSIPRTLAQMNATGTLDTGNAGIVRGQLESQMNKDLSGLLGQAKQVQREDYFNSLDQLRSLYPERFEVKNIPNYLNYMNDTNQYNADLMKNFGMAGQNAQGSASSMSNLANLFGQAGGFINSVGGFGAGRTNQTKQTVNPNAPGGGYGTGGYNSSINYASTGGGMFNPYGNQYAPQNLSSNTTSSTPEMGGNSGGLDFKKLLQMFAKAGVAGASGGPGAAVGSLFI